MLWGCQRPCYWKRDTSFAPRPLRAAYVFPPFWDEDARGRGVAAKRTITRRRAQAYTGRRDEVTLREGEDTCTWATTLNTPWTRHIHSPCPGAPMHASRWTNLDCQNNICAEHFLKNSKNPSPSLTETVAKDVGSVFDQAVASVAIYGTGGGVLLRSWRTTHCGPMLH